MNAGDWGREDSAATVIARTIRSVRLVEAMGRMQVEGIGLGPGVFALAKQYADGAMRMPEFVYRAHARVVFEAAQQAQGDA